MMLQFLTYYPDEEKNVDDLKGSINLEEVESVKQALSKNGLFNIYMNSGATIRFRAETEEVAQAWIAKLTDGFKTIHNGDAEQRDINPTGAQQESPAAASDRRRRHTGAYFG